MLEWQPGSVLVAAVHALLDKVHAFDAVVNVRINRVELVPRSTGGSRHDVVIGRAIHIGERFKERFRMTGGQAASGFAGVVHVRRVRIASVERMRMTVATQRQNVRFFLSPLDRALRTVDFDGDVVFATVRNLAGSDRTETAVFKANNRVSVVIKLATRFERLQVAMSPKQPAAPDLAGSVRQAACFWSLDSSRVRNQPWM